ASGDVEVPAKLRYQACDANLCYPPQTATVTWRIRVVPASAAAPAPDAAVASTFAGIKFGRGEKPGSGGSGGSGGSEGSQGSQGSQGSENSKTTGTSDGLAKLDAFTVLGTSGGYLGADEFLKFIHDAETGVKPRGMFEGRGPLMILLLVLVGGLALNLTPCVLP